MMHKLSVASWDTLNLVKWGDRIIHNFESSVIEKWLTIASIGSLVSQYVRYVYIYMCIVVTMIAQLMCLLCAFKYLLLQLQSNVL